MEVEAEVSQAYIFDEFQKAIVNVLVTADRISAANNAALRPFGISKEQYNVLHILRERYPEPSTIQHIADHMISRSSNVTRLVEKIRKAGLVERGLCESDRRKVDILITDAGLALLKKADPLLLGSHEQMRNISEVEARELNRLLEKMRD